MRAGPLPGGASTPRRFGALVSLIALLAAGWASAAHLASAEAQSCSSTACRHDATGQDHRAPGGPGRHDSESCALCRVLSQVPIPAALPAPLPAPKAVVAAPLPAPRSIAPEGYVGFALARGPPSSSPA